MKNNNVVHIELFHANKLTCKLGGINNQNKIPRITSIMKVK